MTFLFGGKKKALPEAEPIITEDSEEIAAKRREDQKRIATRQQKAAIARNPTGSAGDTEDAPVRVTRLTTPGSNIPIRKTTGAA